MISLFIDTALSYTRIAIIKDNELFDEINEFSDKDLSKEFIKKVETLLNKNNININDIKKIYCVTGPGSFTGIRVGMTFVKVLGFSKKIDIIPISELQVLASTKCKSEFIAPLINARRGYVYAGLYNQDLKSIIKDKYIKLEEYIETIKEKDVTYISLDKFEEIKTQEPNIDILSVVNKNKDTKSVNAHFLVPNYLKDTEAEEKLREKQKND